MLESKPRIAAPSMLHLGLKRLHTPFPLRTSPPKVLASCPPQAARRNVHAHSHQCLQRPVHRPLFVHLHSRNCHFSSALSHELQAPRIYLYPFSPQTLAATCIRCAAAFLPMPAVTSGGKMKWFSLLPTKMNVFDALAGRSEKPFTASAPAA